MTFEKALEELTHEQLIDCERRGMLGSVKQIRSYLWEVEEVKKAEIEMKRIDADIDNLNTRERKARENRIKSQRKRFLSMVYDLKYDTPVDYEEIPQTTSRTLSIQRAFRNFTQSEENKSLIELY